MIDKELYMRRCHELAILGKQEVSPNPTVGSLIVDNQIIIGEGWHQRYGDSHAEINALSSVKSINKQRVKNSSIYVSLEPCSIYGRTPPCTEAIIDAQIQSLYIASRDLTKGVNHVSENSLKQHNLELNYGVGYALGDLIAEPRNIFVSKKRPYIILKWAQSSDGYIAKENEASAISNQVTLRYVHQMRAEVDAILVGKRTAIIDDPALTTRYHPGKNPLRIVLGDLSDADIQNMQILQDGNPTLIFSKKNQNTRNVNVETVIINDNSDFFSQICDNLYTRNIQNILIEGGAKTLQSFLEHNLWDECRIITNSRPLGSGTKGPTMRSQNPSQSFSLHDDRINIYHNHSKES